MSHTDGLASAAQPLLARLAERIPMACWAVTRRSGDRLSVVAVDGALAPFTEAVELAWSGSLDAVLASGAPAVAADATASAPYRRAARPLGVRSFVGAAMRTDDGEFVGAVFGVDTVAHPRSHFVDVGLVEATASALAVVVRAERDAHVDALTGLANRRAWERTLGIEDARCARSGRDAAIIAVDLDDLKTVNDKQGHPAGDALIRLAARTLAGFSRGGDVVARVGGDEFAVFAADTTPGGARIIASRLAATLTRAGVAASTGVATRSERQTLAAAWAAADRAMYQAKRRRHGDVAPVPPRAGAAPATPAALPSRRVVRSLVSVAMATLALGTAAAAAMTGALPPSLEQRVADIGHNAGLRLTPRQPQTARPAPAPARAGAPATGAPTAAPPTPVGAAPVGAPGPSPPTPVIAPPAVPPLAIPPAPAPVAVPTPPSSSGGRGPTDGPSNGRGRPSSATSSTTSPPGPPAPRPNNGNGGGKPPRS